jgi:hypothetical protein
MNPEISTGIEDKFKSELIFVIRKTSQKKDLK